MKNYRDANRRMLITNVAWKRRKRRFNVLLLLRDASIYLYFALSVIWLELIFRIRFFEKVDVELVHAVLFSVCLSIIPAAICSVLPKKAGKITTIVFSVCLFLMFAVQAVYYEVFKTFLIPFSMSGGAGEVLGLWKMIFGAIGTQWLTILLYALPLLFLIIIGRKIISFGRLHILHTVIAVVGAVAIHILLISTLRLYGTDVNTPYYLYNKEYAPDTSIEKLGLMTTMRLDFKNLIMVQNDAS